MARAKKSRLQKRQAGVHRNTNSAKGTSVRVSKENYRNSPQENSRGRAADIRKLDWVFKV